MNISISVIIPAFNREKHIAKAIQSVLDQDYEGHVEIILSDDGSTDNTIAIAEAFGSTVRILRKPENCRTQGASSTRNRGIKIATKPYICFLDSDDFFLPGHLNKMAIAMKDNPEIGYVFCRTLEIKDENGSLYYRPWTHQRIFDNDIKNPSISRDNVVHTNSFIFRREVFEKVGYFNESYKNGEDSDLWIRVSEMFTGKFSDHYGAVYRVQHSFDQLTKNSENEILKTRIAIYKEALKRYYSLGLNDSNRIFELKHLILHNMYRNQKYTYGLCYLILILKYPKNFLFRAMMLASSFDKRKNSKIWERDFNTFI